MSLTSYPMHSIVSARLSGLHSDDGSYSIVAIFVDRETLTVLTPGVSIIALWTALLHMLLRRASISGKLPEALRADDGGSDSDDSIGSRPGEWSLDT